MLHSIIAHATQSILAMISDTGYLGVILLMAAESACLPIPSEIIMPFAGYLAATGHFNLWLCATAGAIGCNLGSAIAYEVGAAGAAAGIMRGEGRVLVGEGELARAIALFRRFGSLAVFLCRLLPIVRTYIALPAGMARMNRLRFHIYTFAGSWIWCFLLAWAGYWLGDQWDRSPALRAVMHGLDGFVLVLLLCGVVAWFAIRQRRAAD